MDKMIKISQELLERASFLVGNPGTGISGSTDCACQQWQKDYEIFLRDYDPKDKDSIKNDKGWIADLIINIKSAIKEAENQYIEDLNRPFLINKNMIELDRNIINNKEDLDVHISNCDMNTWWWGDNYNIIVDKGAGSVLLYYKTKEPHTAWICNLRVASSMRKKGLGTMLLNICIDKAKVDDKTFIKLYADKTKEWLVNWYKNHGFIITEECDHEFELTKITNK